MRSKDHHNEKGQAVLLVVVVAAIFLFGAVGLAVDTSQLFFQQQMAQVAADAAAQAAMLSVFQGTNAITGHAADFPISTFPCSGAGSYPNSTPCRYAIMNGFGSSASDVVTVSFPTCSLPNNVCATTPSTEVQVTINRPVANSFIRFLGAGATTTINATAIAAVLNTTQAVPLLITDPNNKDTLSMNGTTEIKICGGPNRSIQINSANTAGGYTGGGAVDLSQAGPADPGTCTAASAGADFGTFGGPTTQPGSINLGTAGTGHYRQPASPIADPLATVSAPAPPSPPANPHGVNGETIHSPTDGCTSTCTEYYPGLYTQLNLKNDTVLFKPGLYYIQGPKNNNGFTMKNITGGGSSSAATQGLPNGMCTGCAADTNTGTGMVVYDTGPSGSAINSNPSGGFTIDTGVSIFLSGSTKTAIVQGNTVPTSPYYGVLFWEDRTADANSHGLGTGNASFAWTGTIYITNTLAIMQADSTHVQKVSYNGGPAGTTILKGNMIVGQLSMVGNTTFMMQLIPYAFLTVNQVALVGGGPHS